MRFDVRYSFFFCKLGKTEYYQDIRIIMITALYTSLFVFFYMKITIDVIKARRKNLVSTGYGPDGVIRDIVSAHANFSSYAPLTLIMLFLLESSHHLPGFVIHILGVMTFLGRVFHFQAFSSKKMNFKKRVLGMQLTIFPMILMAIGCLYIYLKTTIGF